MNYVFLAAAFFLFTVVAYLVDHISFISFCDQLSRSSFGHLVSSTGSRPSLRYARGRTGTIHLSGRVLVRFLPEGFTDSHHNRFRLTCSSLCS